MRSDEKRVSGQPEQSQEKLVSPIKKHGPKTVQNALERTRTGRQNAGFANSFLKVALYPIRKKLGLAKVKFHDLRHTQASLMLYAGVDMKTIQQRLGHSSFATTADMYAHLMQDSQAKASDKLSALMSKPSEASEYIS